jgi:hypothetical protein
MEAQPSDRQMRDQEFIALEADSVKIVVHADTLAVAARFLEVVVIIGVIAVVVAGISIALTTGTDAQGNTTHPYVAAGVAVVVGGVVSGVVYWALARALHLFGEYTSFRTRATVQNMEESEE